MKKLLAIFLVAALSLAVTSCGKKVNDASNNTDPALTEDGEFIHADGETSAVLDENGNEIPGTSADNAGKEVDMEKVAGESLAVVENETNDSPSEGTISYYDVSIDDAKIIESDGTKAVIISYTFKNNTSSPMSFDGIMATEVTQGGASLIPTVVTGFEGINVHSAYETIAAGDETTLQKAFLVTDTDTAIDVVVYKYAEPNSAQVAKSFKLK